MEYPAPRQPAQSEAGHDRYGPEVPDSPVVISVPHAGRAYDAAMLAQLRVRPETLRRLEDRFADLLVHRLIGRGHSVVVARVPRACIDMNRNPSEIDPDMLAGVPRDARLQTSAKLRGGLGLIPRRLPVVGDIWQGRIGWAEAQRRIAAYHAPYHEAVARLMLAAREAHGHAILIDLHSMPSLPIVANRPSPRIVLGDRFGRSCPARLMTLAGDIASGHGFLTAHNHPYAGDHMLDRHGRPALGLHAMQIEVDRALYLDPAMERPAGGLAKARAVVTDMVEALAVELPRAPTMLAAE